MKKFILFLTLAIAFVMVAPTISSARNYHFRGYYSPSHNFYGHHYSRHSQRFHHSNHFCKFHYPKSYNYYNYYPGVYNPPGFYDHRLYDRGLHPFFYLNPNPYSFGIQIR